MTTPKNIDIFNKIVVQTLITLYDNFPRPIDLDPINVGMGVLFKEEPREETEEYKLLVESPQATIDFLVAEGFIRFKPENRHLGRLTFPDAVLTAKGLALLSKVPESVDESKDRRPYIDRIKTLAADGFKSAFPDVIGNVVSGLLGSG